MNFFTSFIKGIRIAECLLAYRLKRQVPIFIPSNGVNLSLKKSDQLRTCVTPSLPVIPGLQIFSPLDSPNKQISQQFLSQPVGRV